MFGLEQNENSLKKVLISDIVLDVVGVVFNTERQQLHDD